MNDDTGTSPTKGKPERRARGFLRASILVEPQTRNATAKRGYVEARLRALWSEIAGPEIAAVTAPVKLAAVRGPAGGLLTLGVAGANGPQVQLLLPLIRERVNAALGPNTVGRIQITQAVGLGFAEPPASFARQLSQPAPDLSSVRPSLSSIGDDGLRAELETLARNVLSKSEKSSPTES